MPAGRPTKMTEEVLRKLEDAYLSDATHLQAAIFAGIGERTLHDYREAHPDFSQRIESLKGMTCLKAKNNIRKAIEHEGEIETDDNGKVKRKSTNTSKWLLERRDKDYKYKQETEHTGGLTLLEQIMDEEGGERPADSKG